MLHQPWPSECRIINKKKCRETLSRGVGGPLTSVLFEAVVCTQCNTPWVVRDVNRTERLGCAHCHSLGRDIIRTVCVLSGSSGTHL